VALVAVAACDGEPSNPQPVASVGGTAGMAPIDPVGGGGAGGGADAADESGGSSGCVSGQYGCQGPNVVQCEPGAAATWEVIETCDPAADEVCDPTVGTCVPSIPIGGTEPSGTYYKFAEFTTDDSVFAGGADVDSWDDKLYVTTGAAIDVYAVTLLDSDGDGELEPNQHPSNPEHMGAIEARALTFVESVPWPTQIPVSVAEIYATGEGIWLGGTAITALLAENNGETSVIADRPAWLGNLSHLGYDDVNGVWYASEEARRRVVQYDDAGSQWGIAFSFPTLAGDHMDGLEVVTQPGTDIPFVYVSDMTSDFIGQYRFDADQGWVQENLFEYADPNGLLVEGMGFGAFQHFWITSVDAVYEVGGGDLADFTQTAP